MDFREELNRLIAAEPEPLSDVKTELLRGQSELLKRLYNKSGDMSLQIEEIYDIISRADTNEKELSDAKALEREHVIGIIALCDLIDAFVAYLKSSTELFQNAELIESETEKILVGLGIARIGKTGEPLDAKRHNVHAGKQTDIPHELVIEVLQYGYEFRGTVIRKATVDISI